MDQKGHTTNILQNGQAECYYSIADMWRLRSETRDGVTKRIRVIQKGGC